ncbi:uncharacterized protein LOC134278961 [Saccostrea cucullata]|uniref:uncharacterized protein LOC134278961 n=1 Tax=Saccostrea cuccullata TaxID=36930 RepID=UPI002ED62D9F
MYRLVLQKSVTVSGVSGCSHISLVSTDRVWISDYKGNLILTNTTGDILDSVTDLRQYGGGVHTVNSISELIYKGCNKNIIKLSKDKVKTTVIPYTSPWTPLCVYSSPSTGDLLVGIRNTDTYREGQVNRYSNTGEHIQTIQHDNTGQGLYSEPNYITENCNGDVIVSDSGCDAVVVTDSSGKHRFSYTGPTSGSELSPCGICTDALSHILVCDPNTDTIHIIDQDGLFLTQLETKQHGIGTPVSLSYDCDTQLLWVGSLYNNKVNIYRLINEGDGLTDKVEGLKTFLRKERTTVSHARGILVGCAEAGKTTLLKRLRGQSQNVGEVTDSTRGLEVHQHVFIVKDGILEVAEDDSPLKTFIRINVADLKPKISGEVDISNPNENRDNSELKSPDKKREEISSREEEKVELSSPPTEVKEEVNTVEVMASVLSSEAQKMVKDEIFQKILSEKENLPTVSMLDFAGQLAYYACHQIYVTPKAFFILVLDMTKKFEDVVEKEKDNQEGSIFSVWTYKDYLKFWITSIKTFGGTKAPMFIIVTHTERTSKEVRI